MKTLKASKEFVIGKHAIGWVGSNFKEHFYGMTFEMPEKPLASFTLPRLMNDREILNEFHPKEATLGDFLFDIKSGNGLMNGYANIFYIRDKKGELWVPYWLVLGGKFHVEALSSSDPYAWVDGGRVSGGCSSAPLAVPSDSLPLELTINGVTYKRV